MFGVIQQFETPEDAAGVAKSRSDCQPCRVPGGHRSFVGADVGCSKRRKAIRTRHSKGNLTGRTPASLNTRVFLEVFEALSRYCDGC